MGSRYKILAEDILDLAGIKINGSHPWDITVHNDGFYRRAITEGELGIGESYMEGWWDCPEIDQLICLITKAGLEKKIRQKLSIVLRLLKSRIFNLQSKRRAFEVGEKHYDLGNDLFRNMLDPRMNYSCGYWKEATGLNQAQEDKLRLICSKLGLKPGMSVLDIGCGWGAFGKYAAENYGVTVTGITVSKEQVELGRNLCHGLPVDIVLMDYRDIKGKFDRIVSVGMIEHVGYKNYRTFFETASDCLAGNGLFLLQTIGSSFTQKSIDLWTDKYIFPNGMLPSVRQLAEASEGIFIIEDWHSFGADYDRTLMAWYRNFEENWDKIKNAYSERFYRMWKYFLLSSAGAFRSGNRNQLWQIVFSKNSFPGGYCSVR
jgi:cyclopropane-fatty-acyl-phospholipid synthase